MKTPLINASLATLYIVGIVLLVQFGIAVLFQGPETFMIPIVMLSLFVLSAAVMGYLFLAMPIQLYLDGHKKAAVMFFGKTVGIFALLTGLLIVGTVLALRSV